MAEQGDKNEMISDADKKFDALMDMIKDACGKMDEGGKRLDARMDAMEDSQRRMDARMDGERRDGARRDGESDDEFKARKDAEEKERCEADKARRDAEEAEKLKGDPKEVAADKARRDADEKEKAEKVEADKARKDADEKEAKEKAEADARKDGEHHADSQFMTRAEATALRSEIASLQARAPAILSDADRERFASIQADADPVFQAFNDRAPGPLEGETPTQYKRRLGSKLQAHSPKWKDHRLSAVSDDGILDTILADVYADSMVAARRGVDVPRGQLRMITRQSGGHTINEFEGDTDAWINQFAGHSQRGTGDWRRPH